MQHNRGPLRNILEPRDVDMILIRKAMGLHEPACLASIVWSRHGEGRPPYLVGATVLVLPRLRFQCHNSKWQCRI